VKALRPFFLFLIGKALDKRFEKDYPIYTNQTYINTILIGKE
jgi:hypothetical protein